MTDSKIDLGKAAVNSTTEVKGDLAEAATAFGFALLFSTLISVLRGVIGGALVAYATVSYLAADNSLNALQWTGLVIGALLIVVDIDRRWFKGTAEKFSKLFDAMRAKEDRTEEDKVSLGYASVVAVFWTVTVIGLFIAAAFVFAATLYNTLQANEFSFGNVAWLCISGVWVLDGVKSLIRSRWKKWRKKDEKQEA